MNDQTELVAYIGQNFSIECKLLKPDRLDRIVYFGWYRYHGYNETTEQFNVGDQLSTKPTLTITNVTKADEDSYICAITDQIKGDHKVFNITVKDPNTGKL